MQSSGAEGRIIRRATAERSVAATGERSLPGGFRIPLPGREWGRRLILALLAVAAWGPTPSRLAADEPKFYEKTPYDVVEFKDGSSVKVERLGRPIPQPTRPSDKLVVRLFDDEAKEQENPPPAMEALWRDIEKVHTFESLVLDETNRLVGNKKFDEAYDYFRWLLRMYPRLEGLESSIQGWHFAEAQDLRKQGRREEALALLNEVHRRNPQFAGLEAALSQTAGELIDARLNRNEYDPARALLQQALQRFPQNAELKRRHEVLSQRAQAQLEDARRWQLAGRSGEARDAALAAVRIWPLDEAQALLEEAQARSPRVVVGVTSLPRERGVEGRQAGRLEDWASLRTSRLLQRTLLEFVGCGPQGGDYRSPLGDYQKIDLGRKLVFNVNPSVRWSGSRSMSELASGGAALDGGDEEGGAVDGSSTSANSNALAPAWDPTDESSGAPASSAAASPATSQLTGGLAAADLSRHLLAMAEPGHLAYRPEWADLFAGLRARDLYEVEVDLRRPHVHPDGLLRTAVMPWNLLAPEDELPSNGPYLLASEDGPQHEYRLNPAYFATGARQPREIVERYYASSREASMALKRGDVAILDRVSPWEAADLQQEPHLTVAAYATPTVHVLIPRGDHPLLSQRIYRKAILSGINREGILQQLLREAEPAGSRVVSGPFPFGESSDSSLGYANNPAVPVRPYSPHLSLVLASLAERHEEEARKKRDESAETSKPRPLILAHPAHDTARTACRSIQRQLKLVGIAVELREFGQPDGPGLGEHDLLYAELSMWEPVIDARYLLGEEGLTPFSSSYTRLALRQLEQLNDWRSVRAKLQEIHRLTADDASVLPLWQLTEHFAYHNDLKNVPPLPATLYQGVESWQSPPAILSGAAR